MQTSERSGLLLRHAGAPFIVVLLFGCRVPAPPLGPPAFAAAGVVVAVAPAHIEVQNGNCKDIDRVVLGREIDKATTSALAAQGFSVARDVSEPHDLMVAPQMAIPKCNVYTQEPYDPELALEISQKGVIVQRLDVPIDGVGGSSEYPARLQLGAAMMQRSPSVARAITHKTEIASDARPASPAAQPTPGPKASGASAPLALRAPMRILVLPLKPVSGTTMATCNLLTNYMLSQLEQVKLMRTVGQGDVEQTLGVDRQRQALGCDALSCMAEIGGALGVDYVMYGEVGALGSKYNVNVSVVRTRDASVAARWSALVEKTEDALAAQVPVLVEQIVARLNER